MRPGFRNHLFVRAKAGYLLTQSLREDFEILDFSRKIGVGRG
jgi:hypothetical protein